MKTILHHLSDIFPLLATAEVSDKIIQNGTLKYVEAGKEILSIGTKIHTIPLICEGCLKVVREDEDGNELLLYYLFPGDTCAMSLMCCSAGQNSSVRVSAEDDTTLIAIDAFVLEDWTNRFPAWKNFVLSVQRQRFEDLLNVIDNIAFKHLDQRLENYIEAYAVREKSSTLSITHQEIARDLNSSREVISRLLKQLEKTGKIKLSRNQIELV